MAVAMTATLPGAVTDKPGRSKSRGFEIALACCCLPCLTLPGWMLALAWYVDGNALFGMLVLIIPLLVRFAFWKTAKNHRDAASEEEHARYLAKHTDDSWLYTCLVSVPTAWGFMAACLTTMAAACACAMELTNASIDADFSNTDDQVNADLTAARLCFNISLGAAGVVMVVLFADFATCSLCAYAETEGKSAGGAAGAEATTGAAAPLLGSTVPTATTESLPVPAAP